MFAHAISDWVSVFPAERDRGHGTVAAHDVESTRRARDDGKRVGPFQLAERLIRVNLHAGDRRVETPMRSVGHV